MKYRIGIVQMNTRNDVRKNLEFAHSCVIQGGKENIDLIAFPETFLYINDKMEITDEIAQPLDGSNIVSFQEHARKYQISIILGSVWEKIPDNDKLYYNTSVLINRDGEIGGFYRKIHLFDIDRPNVKHKESTLVKAGKEPVVIDHEIGKIGLTICYDIRFPGIYQYLTSLGAEIIFTPSAFYLETGKDHWFPILKARAIENQVYIIAPAQWGKHHNNRTSFGNSLVVDPWGTVILCASEKTGLFSCTIDMEYLKKIRENMPVIQHQKYDHYRL